MYHCPMTHSDLINLWPTLADFADDIGVPYMTAKGMRRRGSVPGGYWIAMECAARRRGIDGVDVRRLAEIVAVVSNDMAEAVE